jgi:hypothetical protein
MALLIKDFGRACSEESMRENCLVRGSKAAEENRFSNSAF